MAALFGEGEVQPFRVVSESRQVGVIGYTLRPEHELRRRAQEVADPAMFAACDWAQLAVKQMPDQWPVGRRLGFEVRTCPVVRLARNLETGGNGHRPAQYDRGTEMDAWLHRRLSDPGAHNDDGRETVYGEWLRDRVALAASVDEVRLEGFRRVDLVRRDHAPHRHARVLERPDALLRGILTVVDGAAFGGLLAAGIGRHRAYGFGMLLLRPPE